jgi:uncharacterized coiled-coil protein SlyX
MNADPLELVQTKIAFLERANVELSDVVFRQQREIELLHARLNAMLERLDATQSSDAPSSLEDDRPPHY